MSVEGVSGLAVAATAGGALLIWSGIRGVSVTKSLGSLISGKPPDKTQTTPIAANFTAATSPAPASTSGTQSSSGGLVSGASASGNAIAQDALKYVGQGYVWGGPANRPGNWDCSSFVSYVLGHDLGMPIPGGSWAAVTGNGTRHGPVSGSYMLFGKGITLSQVRAGDLIASPDHIGIAISPTQMVSAQSASSHPPTGIANFPAGFPGGPPTYRRVSSG